MSTATSSAPDTPWFRNLLDAAEEVYFRYSLDPMRGFMYLSPSVEALTGHSPQAFVGDPSLCLTLIQRDDRRLVRQILRSRRSLSATLHLHLQRGADPVVVQVRTVPVIRSRRIVAVEGMVRRVGTAAPNAIPGTIAAGGDEGAPTPQRLAALMYEVHALLHRVLPEHERRAGDPKKVITVGDMDFDLERLTATEGGRAVSLTSREVMVLRYLLTRPGRIVTRTQLLTEVWGYHYTGDDRTIDVHVSRLRRKLPSLASRLVAVKHVGYRLDCDDRDTVRPQAS